MAAREGGSDDVDDLHALLVAGLGQGAPDLGDSGGAGELDPLGCLDDFDGAGDLAAVAAAGDPVAGDLLPGHAPPRTSAHRQYSDVTTISG